MNPPALRRLLAAEYALGNRAAVRKLTELGALVRAQVRREVRAQGRRGAAARDLEKRVEADAWRRLAAG